MQRFRTYIDSFVIEAPLPNINPDIISVLSVFMMVVAFLYPDNIWWVFVFVAMSLLMDWLDGVVARKFKRTSRRGYWVDVICDRLSELMLAIFSPLLWVPLFSINVIMTFVNMKTKVHLILPLRAAFLVFLLFRIFGIDFGWI